MAISLKHNFQSAVADGGDTSLVQPSNWNAEHDLTLATSRLIGRTSAGAGSAEEISVGTGLNLSSGSLAVSSTTPQVNSINTFTAAQVISVTDNSNAALRITQEGTGNAFVVEDSANPDSTPFVIDASGNVTTSSRVSLTGSSQTNTGAASILNMSQTWNAPTIAVTSVSGDGTSVTLTHAAQASAVPVGSTINVSGFTPSGYNTATGAVTASTTTTTTYTNSNTAAVTVLGQFQVNIVTPILLNITNTSSAGVPSLLDLRVNGTSQFFVSRAGAIQSASGMLIQNTAAYAWSGRGFLTSPAAGGVQLGNTDAAAPVAQTLSAQSVVAGTSNTSGVDLTIRGSRGTGTGAGGSIIFQTAAAGSSGTAQNAASERFRIDTSGALGIGGANYGTSGQVLTSAGSGAAPTWSTPSAAAGGMFYENDITLTTNYTITTNKNAMTAGPVTINSGVTVTVPSGSTWTIV